jgi:leucine-rich repeat protein SHOC2
MSLKRQGERIIMLKRLMFVVVFCGGVLALVLWGLPASTASVTAAPDIPAAYDCTAQSDIPQAECEALVAIYDSNPSGNFGSGWLEAGVSPCDWNGVTCIGGAVTTLRLNFALLTAVPPEIENLPNLTELNLENNLITAVPPEIGNLLSLDNLDLSGNQLTAIPLQIGTLSNLGNLDLSSNQLTAVPPEIGNLSSLTALYLFNNQLTAVPPEIGNLSNLTNLFINLNQLTAVPPEIGNLSNLTLLYLDRNQLTTVPPEIGNLSNLVSLNLSQNQLTTVPSEIGNLSSLERLDLRNNQLTALPPEIGNLSNLSWLSLNSNRFAAVPSEIWNLTNLTELSLVNNQLTVVPSEIGNLSNLEWLSFGGNQLTAVPSEIWNLSSLKGLYLQDNQLTIVPPEIGNLTSLEFLVLNGNQLTAMPPEIADLSSLTVFSLYNNSLTGPLPGALLSLNLNIFYFYNNEWCLPDETAYQTWLASIDTVIGTGRVCGQPGGSISGRVTLSDATPVNNTIVALYRQDVLSGDELVATTRTDSAGDYQFDDLGQGINYYVYFTPPDASVAPQYYNGQGTLNTAASVTTAAGTTTTGINAVLSLPQSPLANVNSSNGSVTTNPTDGSVVVAQRNGNTADITVTRTVLCADNSTPLSVTLTLADNAYPMSATGNPDEYSAVIPANEVVAGTLTVVAACNGGNQPATTSDQLAAVGDQPTTIGTVTLV